MSLNGEQVLEYLQSHPEFFEANALPLSEVHIPHPHGGRAISIVERQVLTLREKNRLLESKLAELIQYGEENDALAEKIHKFCCALIEAADFSAAVATVYSQILDNFHVPHALIRLWHPGVAQDSRPEAEPVIGEVREFVAAMKTPYCGQHAVYETNRWFGDAAPHLKSFAAVRLGEAGTFGVLLLASEDAERFYPEMDTLYLARIGELASRAIATRIRS